MTPTGHERESGTEEGQFYAVFVGDVSSSRQFRDQKKLFAGLRSHFAWVNQQVAPVQRLQFTVGDEFQAAYRDVASAFRAAILLRLRFKTEPLPEPAKGQDVRIGFAYGQISVFDEADRPFGQSGEAWWNARRAIEHAEQAGNRRYMPESIQSRYYGDDPLLTAMTNGFLLALDQVLYRLDRTDVTITLATLTGRTQKDIAAELRITQPSVSRRSTRNGPFTIARILDELAQVPTT